MKSQNLRDQASRLEKIELDESARAGDSDANINRTSYIAAADGYGSSQEFSESENQEFSEIENQNIIGHLSENANFSLPPSNLDLHTHATRSLEDARSNDSTSVESPPQFMNP